MPARPASRPLEPDRIIGDQVRQHRPVAEGEGTAHGGATPDSTGHCDPNPAARMVGSPGNFEHGTVDAAWSSGPLYLPATTPVPSPQHVGAPAGENVQRKPSAHSASSAGAESYDVARRLSTRSRALNGLVLGGYSLGADTPHDARRGR